MRVYLLDDEPLAVAKLRRMLEATGRAEVAGASSDPVSALGEIAGLAPDAVFLDIEMPGLDGFDVVERLAAPPLIVFTTAYDQYALRAFEVNSVDYLLKPVETAQLDRALTKLERMLHGAAPRRQWDTLLSELKQAIGRPAYLSRLASRVGDRVEFVETSSVSHFYAKDKLTFAAGAAGNKAIDLTIADLEQRLDPAKFVRIHRATIVSVDAIRELHSWFGGKLVVRLKDGKTELAVARDRAGELKQRLGL